MMRSVAAMFAGLMLPSALAAWEVQSMVDPMTDLGMIIIRSEATRSPCGPAHLEIMCDGDALAITFNHRCDREAGRSALTELEYRLDHGPVQITPVRDILDVVGITGDDAVALLSAVDQASRLAVRFPTDRGPTSFAFPVAGMMDAFRSAGGQCLPLGIDPAD
jgi:hypothetical protein